ncbi:MAG: ABC transporter permease [Asticcacaulis sp.]
MSLALSSLIHDWRRYVTAIIALAVSGLLVLCMVGMFVGMGKSNTATVDRSPADIMILSPRSESLYNNSFGQPRRLMAGIYAHPDVVEVQPYDTGWAAWSNFPSDTQPARNEGVVVSIVDPVPDSVTVPVDFSPEARAALRVPYTVLIDETARGRLGVEAGQDAKINGKRIRVGATVSGYPALFNTTIYMSRRTASLLGVYREGGRVGAIMVRIHSPERAESVAAELNIMGQGQYRAWARAELSRRSQIALLKEGGIAIMIGFSVFVSVFIGVVITWQTLQAAISASLKEFATFRAIGIPMFRLRCVVMELSLWVGLAGVAMAAGLSWLMSLLAGLLHVPMAFPPYVTVPVAVGLMLTAMASGFFSLGVLNKVQPADLLR